MGHRYNTSGRVRIRLGKIFKHFNFIASYNFYENIFSKKNKCMGNFNLIFPNFNLIVVSLEVE